MSVPVVLTRIAQREYDDARDWYALQAPGLGDRFRAEVDAVLTQIGATPLRYAVAYQTAREAILSVFPYAVYFRDEGNRVVVISVFHTSRDPAVWQSRA